MNREAYDDFSQDYDHFVNWGPRLAAEMPFILKYIEKIEQRTKRKAHILDAACGSGMHAIELAKLGFQASGADISPKMIEKARENARSAGAAVTFKEAPFGNLGQAFNITPLFHFDLIICLGNAIAHLLTIEKIQSALWDMANCLQPGGYLIFQIRNFDAICRKKERWIKPQGRQADSKEWVFLRFYDFDSDGLITFNILRLHREKTEEWKQQVSTTRLYPLKKDIIVGLLEDSGFSKIACYGLMDVAQPFNPNSSENLIVTACKA